MEYYIVQKNNKTIYGGPDGNKAYSLIPRNISMHKGDIYDFSFIELKDNKASIRFHKDIGRVCWDSGDFEHGELSRVEIPMNLLELLILNTLTVHMSQIPG